MWDTRLEGLSLGLVYLGLPVAGLSQHSLFAGAVVVQQVMTAWEKELAVLYNVEYPGSERQLLLLCATLYPHNQYWGGGMAGQPVPYYEHLSNAWFDKEPCTNCRQHMFNMLLIYQGAIQPKAQMLLTANFGEELVTKQPFNHRNLLFLWILGDQLCLSLKTQSRGTDGGVQLSP